MGEYHEDNLPEEAKEYHRIIKSVIEELEAIDWYNQRAAATGDPTVKAIVEHNRDEEIEHACMGLEWLRRKNQVWDENMRKFFFTQGDITKLEAEESSEKAEEKESSDGSLGIKGKKK